MSVHVSSWAWRQRLGDTSAKFVLLKLADSSNDEGQCWPSQQYLAEHCEMSERNIRFKLEKLEKAGLLKVTRSKKPDGTWNLNLYTLSSGSPLPMDDSTSGNPAEIQRKPTSSETLLETKTFSGSPLPLECPRCGIAFNDTKVGRRRLLEHGENVHGVRAA